MYRLLAGGPVFGRVGLDARSAKSILLLDAHIILLLSLTFYSSSHRLLFGLWS